MGLNLGYLCDAVFYLDVTLSLDLEEGFLLRLELGRWFYLSWVEVLLRWRLRDFW